MCSPTPPGQARGSGSSINNPELSLRREHALGSFTFQCLQLAEPLVDLNGLPPSEEKETQGQAESIRRGETEERKVNRSVLKCLLNLTMYPWHVLKLSVSPLSALRFSNSLHSQIPRRLCAVSRLHSAAHCKSASAAQSQPERSEGGTYSPQSKHHVSDMKARARLT